MDADLELTPSPSRTRRALTLIAVSLVALVCTGLVYLHPSLPAPAQVAALSSRYTVSAVEFVDPLTGWVAAQFESGNVAVLHTADGGETWTRQMSAAGNGHPQYLKFFDSHFGVFALLGGTPVLYRTSDGGASWRALPALGEGASVLSWSFVDEDHGFMLARAGGEANTSPSRLYRTQDGGWSWTDIGAPVAAPDQAYQIHFSFLTTGWLATSGPAPVAYKTDDFGYTWTRVPLPAPAGGWPHAGQFFVGVQPTSGGGALASVVYFPPVRGRSGVGGSIRAFPPLTVRVFDGGKPDTYTYTTVLDRLSIGGKAGAQAPNETVLSTVDNGATWASIQPPSASGAIGYFDAADWWWVGAGSWSKSADGGLSWTDPRNIGVVEPLPGSLQLLDRAHAWFAATTARRPFLEATDDAGVHWRMVTLPPIEDVAQALT
jgi:photosystem II stability/assembly factor-like uncharacterized protein